MYKDYVQGFNVVYVNEIEAKKHFYWDALFIFSRDSTTLFSVSSAELEDCPFDRFFRGTSSFVEQESISFAAKARFFGGLLEGLLGSEYDAR